MKMKTKAVMLTVIIALVTRTQSIPDYGILNAKNDPKYDQTDLKLLPTIPEQLQVLSFLLSSKESCEIYELTERNKDIPVEQNGDYVLLPILNVDSETGKRVFEPYLIRITIVNINTTNPTANAFERNKDFSAEPEDSKQVQSEPQDHDINEPEAIKGQPEALAPFNTDSEVTPPAQRDTTTHQVSDEVRRPKVIVPRESGSKFFSWFTVLYGILIVTFLLFVILNCSYGNRNNQGCFSLISMDTLNNEVRAPLPSTKSQSQRRAYYERI